MGSDDNGDEMTAQILGAFLAFALLLFPAVAQEPPQVVYTPPADVNEARQSAQAFMKRLKGKEGVSFFLTKLELSALSERTYVDWSWGEQGISLTVNRGPTVPLSFDYVNFPQLGVVTDTVLGAPFYGVRLSPDWIVWVEPRGSDRGLGWAKWAADMFSFSLAVVKGRAAFEQIFRESLAK